MPVPRVGEKVWLLAQVIAVHTDEYPRQIEALVYEQDGSYHFNETALHGAGRFHTYVYQENDRIQWKDPDTNEIVLGNFRFAHEGKAWVSLNGRAGDKIVNIKELERI